MSNHYLNFWNRIRAACPLILITCTILLGPLCVSAQNRAIKGTVTDAVTGEPLIGVAVKIQNGQGGTATNVNGAFTLRVPAGAILTISYIGYETQTVTVGDQTDIKVKLAQGSRTLNEVVVVGYGTMKKKDLTGAVTQIRPDKIADQNPNTTQDILRGTPGLTVGLDPNAKGGGTIRIRGQRSVYTAGGHNDPLLVLDGTLFYGELSEINPDDIEQIDVLKDASAAAVYGAKSANGVIIITTKKGKMGKPKFSVTSNVGVATMTAKREVFGPEGYIKYRNDWYLADTYGVNKTTGAYEPYQTASTASQGKILPGYFDHPTDENLSRYGLTLDQWKAYTNNEASASDEEIWAKRLALQGTTLTNYLAGRTFDWYDHSFRNGFNQDHNISVSGASDRVSYYMSLGYLSNQGLAVGNEYKSIRSNLKVEGKISKWLDIGANINFQRRTDGDLAVDFDRQIRSNSPFANYKDADGNLVVYPMGEAVTVNRGYNYDFDLNYRDLDKGFTTFNTIFTAKVKLPFNINYSFNGSPRFQFFHDRYWESASHPAWKGTNGLVNREATERLDWSLNNTLSWEHTFAKKHRFNVTLVQEAEQLQRWKDRIEARNIMPSDALGYHETFYGDKNKSSYDTDDIKETADGMLGRLFYSYDDRYMITTSVRRDGYSAFGSSNPRATFYSAALAWTFTNEKFFKWSPMSTGKLRVSWGQNGNRQLDNVYIALANLGAGSGGAMGYVDASGSLMQYRYLFMDRLSNPGLSWEKTEAFNSGLDFGFLKDRITGSFDFYITPTVDMIMSRALPTFTGFSSITTNLGKVENRGFEITVNSQNIRTKSFSWNSTISYSKYKNTIKHLYYIYDNVVDADGNVIGVKERNDIRNSWFIGQPVSAIWDYRVTGIWQADEVEEAKKYGQRPGDPKVANNYTADDKVNADGSVTPVYNNNDKEFLGQENAPIMWSFRNDLNWKNLSLSFNLYSYWGNKSLNSAYLNQTNGGSEVTYLWNTYERSYWTPENHSDYYARLDSKGPGGITSPSRLYDRSFIRLENVSLSYNLPARLLAKRGVERVKVYGTVRNVAVWAKDKHWEYGDIETFTTSNSRSGLAPRLYTVGLNLTF